MHHIDLICRQCGADHAANMTTLGCPKCGAPLDVRYREWDARAPDAKVILWPGVPIPMPFSSPAMPVSLGEGHTPVVRLPSLGGLMGLGELWAKLEFLNPTGSFKDRGTSVMVSVAKELGVTEIVEDSSGNAGASVAAYAARAGINAHIFVPAAAPAAKVQQIRVYGAVVHSVEGSREAVTEAAAAYCKERGLVYASHNLSPYFIEGTKTFAYEVAQESDKELPGHIVVPVGNGSLFIGAWVGFTELQQAGRISALPRLHCIQARAVMPIAAAFTGEAWQPRPGQRTVAGGISVGAPPRKQQVLDVLTASGGVALAVDDDQIVRWQRLLAQREGIYAEPTSAAAFAGLSELVKSGVIGPEERVLVPVTGFGLKDAPPA